MGELGSRLTRVREARGLTLEDAERDTRISRRYLQALEAEQFDAIPAPVYARGFLRSYSQYLGLDPQEMLSLFPRPDEPAPAPPPRQANGRPPGQASAPPQGPRPTWRGPQQPPARNPQQGGGQPRQHSATLPKPPSRPVSRPDADYSEPVIGVDIGVPPPSRRLNTDPAAQTRSVVIAVVAIGAVLAVVLLALLISNLGGSGSATPGI